jgi:hypothetical protein
VAVMSRNSQRLTQLELESVLHSPLALRGVGFEHDWVKSGLLPDNSWTAVCLGCLDMRSLSATSGFRANSLSSSLNYEGAALQFLWNWKGPLLLPSLPTVCRGIHQLLLHMMSLRLTDD